MTARQDGIPCLPGRRRDGGRGEEKTFAAFLTIKVIDDRLPVQNAERPARESGPGYSLRMDMIITQFGGDSTVTDVRYEEGRITFRYIDGDTGRTFRASRETDRLRSRSCSEEGSVHVRVGRTAEHLPVEQKSGLYVPPPDFGSQMAMVGEGHHPALGLRADEYPFFLQVRGYEILVACPLRSVDQVRLAGEGGGEA